MAPHYFSPDVDLLAQRRSIRVELAGQSCDVVTADGVFSNTRLDPGTAVLLRTLGPPSGSATEPDVEILDLGCGWGPIAITLGLQTGGKLPPQIWALDVNPQAVAVTRLNAANLGLANIRGVEPQDVPANLQFDQIWSNPPIRIGKPALHELLATWLPRLKPHGFARLVVAKNLGSDSLAAWMTSALALEVTKLASSKGFRVFEVTRPPASM